MATLLRLRFPFPSLPSPVGWAAARRRRRGNGGGVDLAGASGGGRGGRRQDRSGSALLAAFVSAAAAAPSIPAAAALVAIALPSSPPSPPPPHPSPTRPEKSLLLRPHRPRPAAAARGQDRAFFHPSDPHCHANIASIHSAPKTSALLSITMLQCVDADGDGCVTGTDTTNSWAVSCLSFAGLKQARVAGIHL